MTGIKVGKLKYEARENGGAASNTLAFRPKDLRFQSRAGRPIFLPILQRCSNNLVNYREIRGKTAEGEVEKFSLPRFVLKRELGNTLEQLLRDNERERKKEREEFLLENKSSVV